MRVLLLNQFYIPDPCATGQLLADLAATLVGRGHEVHVVASRRSYRGGRERWPAEAVCQGVQVHRIAAPGLGRAHFATRIADCAGFYPLAAARICQLPRPDVCLALTMPPYLGALALALRHLRGVPYGLWLMDLMTEAFVRFGAIRAGGPLHHLLGRLDEELHRGADFLVSLGERMTDLLGHGRHVLTIPNWMPDEPAQTLAPSASLARQRWDLGAAPVLMYSGNLGLGHELPTAVEALARAQQQLEIQGVFVGEGQMRPLIEAQVATLGLRHIRFLPAQPLAGLANHLSAADIHLVGQGPEREGVSVPSKLYGALAVGRPVLFIGPLRSEAAALVQASGAGRVVAPGDISGAAVALIELAADAELRQQLGQRARAWYLAHLGRVRSTTRIAEALEAAGKKSQPARP